ncbi:kinetochore CENP-C fungal-like protein [Massariosphaeria phaeospora]|uniref:Kinetochore CENP-C fungal-like protein n=1 Tax=Massariosphaeria phaeospora TaxID=100035 RepID=A0A7C8MKJ2_9PLEO|nr:kinetochore CENP-C fungal-like protein [Massariosphaeria phaeospora]
MAPARKRETRENQFYDVGVQGRKTGITLEDRGLRDEHGLEPISGIFSSPEKSPPKRPASRRTGGTETESESMEIQDSSIPELATAGHLMRNSRTHLPPPKARSPMKTALGSSPRRQSSMGPRARSVNNMSSPSRSISHPAVSRRLDFDQEDSSLQETPALSGSGQPRIGKRADIYELEISPTRDHSATLEESLVHEDHATDDGEESLVIHSNVEERYLVGVEDDADVEAGADADIMEESIDIEESMTIVEPVKQPAKRGRKRKSDMLEPVAEEEHDTPRLRKRGPTSSQASEPLKKSKKPVSAPAASRRRSKRVSDMTEEEPSVIPDVSADIIEEDSGMVPDVSADVSEQTEDAPRAAKRRGRPPKPKAELVEPALVKDTQKAKAKEKKVLKATGKDKKLEKENEIAEPPAFKKPKPVAKPSAKAKSKTSEESSVLQGPSSGKLVDVHGNPLPKAAMDQISTTSAGSSRYARGRQMLSIYRELEPDIAAPVGRTGRHRVAPIDFWKNERAAYDNKNSLQKIVKNENQEPPPKKYTNSRKAKGRKRALGQIDEEEEPELEQWEVEDGVVLGTYRDFDPQSEVISSDILESTVAWSQKGINPVDVADGSFKFTKLASAGLSNFLSFGFIELDPEQMKRSKNTRRMHMVFHVHTGAVEAKVFETEFTVHKGGVWQVPRGAF